MSRPEDAPVQSSRARSAWQFSLRGLLLFAAFVAVSCAALMYPSIWWASLCLTGAVIVDLVAVLGAVYRRGSARAFWVGFAVMGWAYLLLVFAPLLDRHVGHELAATKVLAYLEVKLARPENVPFGYGAVTGMGNSAEVALNPYARLNLSSESGTSTLLPPQWYPFQQAGHSLFAVALAVCGGLLARRFQQREEEENRK